jgi:predicted dinucleotide-binding enzyme
MHIALIGSGEMGTCLATKLVKLGHKVSVANSRGPGSLKQFAEETGAEAATVEAVTRNKKVIIVSIPQKNIPSLNKKMFEDLSEDVVIIDTGNYYPTLRDGNIAALEQTGIDSLWVQQQLGHPVIKVFNSILATSIKELGKPKGAENRVSMAVSGDDAKSKEIVFELVDELGFDPLDLGTIVQSWKQQPGSPVYCRDINIRELKQRIEKMEAEEPGKMLEMIIEKRTSDETLMKENYPAYLKSLQD